MKALAVFAVVLLAASGALAGGNPDVVAYIDFDPPNRVHEYTPVLYETFAAYVCFGDLDTGVVAVSFALNDLLAECPGCFAPPSVTELFPGGISIGCDTGSWTTGCTVWSDYCLTETDVAAVRIDLFYLGGSCCIKILDHVWYPRYVRDCDDPPGVDYYCVLSHGSVNGAVCPDGDCATPVEDGSWSTIKSLYR